MAMVQERHNFTYYETISNKIDVLQGDITQFKTDALLTAINSEGMWFGGVDGAIMRIAGDHYHQQARSKMPLKNLQIIIAQGSHEDHRGNFNDVIFVVDDLTSPVKEVVFSALYATIGSDYETISMPSIRMGVIRGVVEK